MKIILLACCLIVLQSQNAAGIFWPSNYNWWPTTTTTTSTTTTAAPAASPNTNISPQIYVGNGVTGNASFADLVILIGQNISGLPNLTDFLPTNFTSGIFIGRSKRSILDALSDDISDMADTGIDAADKLANYFSPPASTAHADGSVEASTSNDQKSSKTAASGSASVSLDSSNQKNKNAPQKILFSPVQLGNQSKSSSKRATSLSNRPRILGGVPAVSGGLPSFPKLPNSNTDVASQLNKGAQNNSSTAPQSTINKKTKNQGDMSGLPSLLNIPSALPNLNPQNMNKNSSKVPSIPNLLNTGSIGNSKNASQKESSIFANLANKLTTNIQNYVNDLVKNNPEIEDFVNNLNQSNPFQTFAELGLKGLIPNPIDALVNISLHQLENNAHNMVNKGMNQIENGVKDAQAMGTSLANLIPSLASNAINDIENVINSLNTNVYNCVTKNPLPFSNAIQIAANDSSKCIETKMNETNGIVNATATKLQNAFVDLQHLRNSVGNCSVKFSVSSSGLALSDAMARASCNAAALFNIQSETVLLPIEIGKQIAAGFDLAHSLKGHMIKCAANLASDIATQAYNASASIGKCFTENSGKQ